MSASLCMYHMKYIFPPRFFYLASCSKIILSSYVLIHQSFRISFTVLMTKKVAPQTPKTSSSWGGRWGYILSLFNIDLQICSMCNYVLYNNNMYNIKCEITVISGRIVDDSVMILFQDHFLHNEILSLILIKTVLHFNTPWSSPPPLTHTLPRTWSPFSFYTILQCFYCRVTCLYQLLKTVMFSLLGAIHGAWPHGQNGKWCVFCRVLLHLLRQHHQDDYWLLLPLYQRSLPKDWTGVCPANLLAELLIDVMDTICDKWDSYVMIVDNNRILTLWFFFCHYSSSNVHISWFTIFWELMIIAEAIHNTLIWDMDYSIWPKQSSPSRL